MSVEDELYALWARPPDLTDDPAWRTRPALGAANASFLALGVMKASFTAFPGQRLTIQLWPEKSSSSSSGLRGRDGRRTAGGDVRSGATGTGGGVTTGGGR
jgi:hypothetical protein